jgi:hypothetical protein
MVISELDRALRGADHPRREALLAIVREGLSAGQPAQTPQCRFCASAPPIRQLDAFGRGRRICSACVVRIATAGDGPVRVR